MERIDRETVDHHLQGPGEVVRERFCWRSKKLGKLLAMDLGDSFGGDGGLWILWGVLLDGVVAVESFF